MTLKAPDLALANWDLHGRILVAAVTNFEEFIIMWRTHFVRSCNPQYLPEKWDVNHTIARTFGSKSKFKSNAEDYLENRVVHKVSKYLGVEAVLHVEFSSGGQGGKTYKYTYRNSINKLEFDDEVT